MGMDKNALAFLTALVLGAGLAACDRADDTAGTGSQSAPPPTSEAPSQPPRQGYTGPATPSSPADNTAGQSGGGVGSSDDTRNTTGGSSGTGMGMGTGSGATDSTGTGSGSTGGSMGSGAAGGQ